MKTKIKKESDEINDRSSRSRRKSTQNGGNERGIREDENKGKAESEALTSTLMASESIGLRSPS